MNPNDAPDDALRLSINQLWTYPIKSCAGIRLPSTALLATGLVWDRAWMVVDEEGEFVSQRDLPRMALIQPGFHLSQLELRAPGMISLHLALDTSGTPRKVRVWDDEVVAWDMGDAPAQWFNDFLMPQHTGSEPRLRLVRFDPAVRRLSSARWTRGLDVPNQFSDGFPVLVLSQAAVDDLNERLLALGHAPVGIERFRPNVVLGGLYAHDEDRLAALNFPLDSGAVVRLEPVKPCARCAIPDIDPQTALAHPSVSDTMRVYRQDRRLMGAVTFGMNAMVTQGVGSMLHEGMTGWGEWSAWED